MFNKNQEHEGSQDGHKQKEQEEEWRPHQHQHAGGLRAHDACPTPCLKLSWECGLNFLLTSVLLTYGEQCFPFNFTFLETLEQLLRARANEGNFQRGTLFFFFFP